MKEIIRGKILETNFYLTEALLNDDVENIERLRAELANLFCQYKNELTK